MDIRIQVAYHFKLDPSKMAKVADIEKIPLPEEITRTVSVGEDFTTEKIATSSLSPWDRRAIREALAPQIVEANRTAQPVADEPAAADSAEEEISAF
jgi:hypothetical protein